MLTAILAITTIVCAIGWLTRWVACAALMKHMSDKNYTPPTDEESKTCCMWVWKKMLHVK